MSLQAAIASCPWSRLCGRGNTACSRNRNSRQSQRITPDRVARGAALVFPHFPHDSPCLSVDYRRVRTLKHKLVFRRVWTDLVVLVRLGISLEVDGHAQILRSVENLVNGWSISSNRSLYKVQCCGRISLFPSWEKLRKSCYLKYSGVFFAMMNCLTSSMLDVTRQFGRASSTLVR